MDPEVLDDARTAVQDALLWRLPAQRWDDVGAALDSLERALGDHRHDVRETRRAVAALELAGPYRAVSSQELALRPPPEHVRERLVQLVDALGDRLGGAEPTVDGSHTGRD